MECGVIIKMTNEFKGSKSFLNIPALVARDKRLLKKPKSILLLGEIYSMLNVTGKFFMSNKALADRLDCTSRAISDYLKLLEDCGYIMRKKVYSSNSKAIVGRYITAGPDLGNAISLGWGTSVPYPREHKFPTLGNGASYKKNSIKEQYKRTKEYSQAEPDYSAQRKQIIEYLNEMLTTKYKPNASKNKSVINARLNEGYSVDDFKKVIDNKYQDWANNSKMAKFLRPETLFGPKFEGYLNEKPSTNRIFDQGYDPNERF